MADDIRREEIHALISHNLLMESNWPNIIGIYQMALERGIHYSELWFRCQDCKKLWAAEQLYFVQDSQEAPGSVELQSVSTYFNVGKQEGGLSEEFDLYRPIWTSCQTCLNRKGIATELIPITSMTISKELQI